MTLRDKLGSIFQDEDFAELFPKEGQPALPPWRLALVTLLQFRENLSDRQAAEALRGRIDWKYLLGLKLTDAGFDFSVLSEFRQRLLEGGQEAILLEKLLEHCRGLGLLQERGKQRTDATRVLAAIRVMSRLELVAETVRAALNDLATLAPDWLRGVAPVEWYQRYSRRIEDDRLPASKEKRAVYAQTVGEDGFVLLDLLQGPEAPPQFGQLPSIVALRQVLARHYECVMDEPEGRQHRQVRFKTNRELPPAAEGIESPYDPEARFRSRHETTWTGYQVHLSETCEPDEVHLITHVETTKATVHESQKTEGIHQALVAKGLPPDQHLVDSAYIDAELLVSSHEQFDITLVGVRVTWTTVGKPRWRVPMTITASRLTGIKSRHAVPKESNRRSGESYPTSTVLTLRLSSMAMIAEPVRPVPYVLATRANLGGCDYSPEFNTRRCKEPANYNRRKPAGNSTTRGLE